MRPPSMALVSWPRSSPGGGSGETVAPVVEERPVAASYGSRRALTSDVAPALVDCNGPSDWRRGSPTTRSSSTATNASGGGHGTATGSAIGTNSLGLITHGEMSRSAGRKALRRRPTTPSGERAGDSTARHRRELLDQMAALTHAVRPGRPSPASVAQAYSRGMDISALVSSRGDAAALRLSSPSGRATVAATATATAMAFFDGYEVSVGLNPQAADSDGDGISDYEELNQGDQTMVPIRQRGCSTATG